MASRPGLGARELANPIILRRRSWPILNWAGLVLLWPIFLGVIWKTIGNGYYDESLTVGAIILAITSVFRRVGTCKIALHESSLRLDNFFTSSSIPYAEIANVSASLSSGLDIQLRDGSEVGSFAFGGSLVDIVFKTSERAAMEIRNAIGSRSSRIAPGGEKRVRRVRYRWTTDSLLLIAAVLAVISSTI